MDQSAGGHGKTKVILAGAGGHTIQGAKSNGERCTSSETSRRQRMTMEQVPSNIRTARQMESLPNRYIERNKTEEYNTEFT